MHAAPCVSRGSASPGCRGPRPHWGVRARAFSSTFPTLHGPSLPERQWADSAPVRIRLCRLFLQGATFCGEVTGTLHGRFGIFPFKKFYLKALMIKRGLSCASNKEQLFPSSVGKEKWFLGTVSQLWPGEPLPGLLAAPRPRPQCPWAPPVMP